MLHLSPEDLLPWRIIYHSHLPKKLALSQSIRSALSSLSFSDALSDSVEQCPLTADRPDAWRRDTQRTNENFKIVCNYFKSSWMLYFRNSLSFWWYGISTSLGLIFVSIIIFLILKIIIFIIINYYYCVDHFSPSNSIIIRLSHSK